MIQLEALGPSVVVGLATVAGLIGYGTLKAKVNAQGETLRDHAKTLPYKADKGDLDSVRGELREMRTEIRVSYEHIQSRLDRMLERVGGRKGD